MSLNKSFVWAFRAGSRSYPELSGFVLNPRIRTFPSGYSCYVYLTNKKSVARYCTEGAMLNIETGTMDHVIAEVALPPLGCVLADETTDRKSAIKEDELCSINHFARYYYNVWQQFICEFLFTASGRRRLLITARSTKRASSSAIASSILVKVSVVCAIRPSGRSLLPASCEVADRDKG